MEYKNEIRKIKELVDAPVWEALEIADCIIAGGTLTSMFCNRDVNDIDVYFRSADKFLDFINICQYDMNYDLVFSNMTDKSILCFGKGENPIQLIVYKFFETPEDIFNEFDFTINMAALECSSDKVTLHPQFLKHNSQRFLSFNRGTAYPLMSALRVQKYLDKGYIISKGEMLKLLLTITELKLDSWSDVKDHVGGMYGLNMDEVFDEERIGEEYSLDKAIEILNNLDYEGSKHKFGDFNFDTLKTQLLDNFYKDLNRVDGTSKLFKCVSLEEDGTLSSHYKSDFKYVVGETVNGGDRGIYFCQGKEILSHFYFKEPNTVIVELGETPNTDYKRVGWTEETMIGDVKVVRMYSKLDFLKTFKFSDDTNNYPPF